MPPALRRSIAAAIDIYDLILGRLERLGYRRPPAQTLGEYARALADASPQLEPALMATDLYYRARYGAQALSADETSALRAFAERLRWLPRRSAP